MWIFYVAVISFLPLWVYLAIFSLRNLKEGYFRAACISGGGFVVSGLVFFLQHRSRVFLMVWISMAVIGAILLLFRLKRIESQPTPDGERFDERDTQFSRVRLRNGTPEYEGYYARYPDRVAADQRIRDLPGLMSSHSKFFNRLNCAAADGTFFLLEGLRSSVDGAVDPEKAEMSGTVILKFVREWLGYQGTECIGTAEVRPGHYYSRSGKANSQYGKEIEIDHTHAIIIGSGMRGRFTSAAPLSPEVMETSIRYANCATAAVETAAFLRNLGYSARAHIDGNYEVIPSLIARDAGLGNFGWSGLLLSHMYGPAVRFAVVTTDLHLPAGNSPLPDYLSFCRNCGKCARCCPCKAISPESIQRINGDRCFAYWNAVGTDCGVCIAVCPMSHPWGLLKRIALKSWVMARILPLLDDLMYGGKHTPKRLSSWMNGDY